MRLPRFYAKKRGHRRTGSREWGVVGDGVFHATLLLAGLCFGGLLVSGVAAPEWRINHEFRETTGTILAKGLAKTTMADPPATVITHWRPCLLVRYSADGVVHESWSDGPSATIDWLGNAAACSRAASRCAVSSGAPPRAIASR